MMQSVHTAVSSSPPHLRVDGRRLLATLGSGAVASAVVGAATYYAVLWLIPSANAGLTSQIIVAEVYSTLIAAFALSFGPLNRPPLDLRFTSAKDLGLAGLAWMGVIGSSLIIYFLLTPVTGGISAALRQILSVATDAKRLDGQPGSAWIIAIARGCLIVPLFEELLFRGLLLGWLGKHLSTTRAVIASAVLFAAMHGYPIALPYAFIYGLFAGWIRERTGSTLNMFFIHVLNNVLFLCLGLSLLK
jgi:membrane protease YdiL (CAAX protease family)